MKHFGKALAVCSAVLLLGNLCAAPIGMNISASAATLTTQSFVPDATNVKLLGRTEPTTSGLWCAYSGTGAAFTFHGTSAVITIAGDSSALASGADTSYARIAIYVNGERVVDDQINEAAKTYTVFESDVAEDVAVEIIKLSETASSTIAIQDITVTSDTGIQPAASQAHKIEFIGDSITCGYGVDDPVKENHFSTATEDATKTYAWKTAKALQADASLVSISGYGVYSGYSSGTLNDATTIPNYYEKFGYTYGAMDNRYASQVDWDFSAYIPDLIVINLGTNDDTYCLGDETKTEGFTAAYVTFLKQIRAKNPDAPILCTLGIMGDRLYPAIEQAVADYTAETGDTNLRSMAFDVQSWNDGYAADWHPVEATHEKAAAKLTDFVNSWLGWDTAQSDTVTGDINADGVCTVSDLILLQKHLIRVASLTQEQSQRADVQPDDCIDAFDLVVIKQILLHIR